MTPGEKHHLALALFRSGQTAEALALLREVLSIQETSEVWNDWAGVQHALDHPEEAEAGFRLALAHDPQNMQAALNLGALLLAQKRAAAAAPFLARCSVSNNPLDRASALQLFSQAKASMSAWDDPQQLETYLRKFVSSDSNERSYFDTHVHRYVQTLLELPAGNPSLRLLELGAAFHHVTPALKHCKNYGEVRCTDIWDGASQETRTIASYADAELFSFVVDNFDFLKHPWPYEDGSFDAVVCCEILEHLHTDPMGLFSEINRILKKHGTLLLTTPNLSSAHALAETLRGCSPYGYGKFELGGKSTDRHNREYTASEVERLALAAGFNDLHIRTFDFYWPGKLEVFRALAADGHPISRRGDATFLLASKEGPVKQRYPEEFYAAVGVQAARRDLQSVDSTLVSSSPPQQFIPQNILLVHELLPHFDCSGADLRLYELLRELSSMQHRVTLLARDSRDEEKYRPIYEALGVHVYAGDPERLRHVGSSDPGSWDLAEVLRDGHFDLAILSHWFWCGISVAEHYLEDIRKLSPATRVFVLSEDRHGERERRSAKLTGLLSDLERGNDFEQRESEIYSRADLVLYVTETDQRHFLKLLPNLATEHLPTIVEAADSGPGFAEREGVLFLGNFENLANRDALDWMLANVWPILHKEDPALRLYIAGYAAPEGLESRYPGVVCIGKVDQMGPLFAQKRVFAAPIRFGTGIITKNMHALAHGLPVVTTTVGAEGMLLENGSHALIADDPKHFAESILRLNRDPVLWQLLSTGGRDYIRGKFCIENLRSQIHKIVSRARLIVPKKHNPNHQWSYREVESAYPSILTQEPPTYRHMLRTLAYWQLGRRHLDAARPAEALRQFRHTFTFIRGHLPFSVFHTTLLDDMARAYRGLGDEFSALLCEKEKRQCVWAWKTKLPQEPHAYKRNSSRNASVPEISVVLPTCNRKEILRVCLASLAFQSLPAHRWEAVVVDDGSDDDTTVLCQETLLPFSLRYLRQENQGPGAARRAGVEGARGEYLLLCNDDTVASSNLLTEHLAAQRQHPHEKRAILGEFRYSESVGTRALSLFVNTSVFFFPQSTLKKDRLYDQAYFVTCNLSIRREEVLKAGNFDPQFRVAEDTELGARLVQNGVRVIYHPEAIAWHEHAQFSMRDLLRRAEAYGAADWRLFQKHPHLLGDGSSPFGKLTSADEIRMQDQVAQYGSAVESGVAALEAMDDLDFRLLFKDKENGSARAEEIMRKVGQIVPMVYWHFLFKRFLAEWQASRQESLATPATSSRQLQSQTTGVR
jgi:GT2 family glycosyltransferase/SAM-dependent methyltransferase/glycosyltransferase involved in cell wall biosynthesis